MPKIPKQLRPPLGAYPFIPLKGKIPAVRNWTTTPPADAGRIAEIEKGNSNYGVVLRSGDLVVDVDPRNFAPGDKPLARLVSAVGCPLSSFTVKTGGGGLHIYFRKPVDVLCAHTLKEYPGLEFKTNGRQVVGPGSTHPESGKPYEVVVDKEIADAPAALLSILKISAVPYSEIEKAKGRGNETYKNDAQTQGQFVEYLRASAPPSVEGKGGDATAFAVACYGRDLGLPPANTLALMGECWNPRCLPPWEDAELEVKVLNAYKYAKGAVGGKHPSSDFKPVATDGHSKGDSGGAGGQAAPGAPGAAVGNSGTGPGVKGEEPITWETTAQGAVKKSFHNLMNYLRLPAGGLYRVFGYNEFTGQVEFLRPAPWHQGKMPLGGEKPGGGSGGMIQDHDIIMLKNYLVAKSGFEMSTATITEAVTATAHAHGCRFHPVREYLDSVIGTWDGVKRVDTWLHDYAGVSDTAYSRAVARKTLCAAVRRIYQPGCKFDHILVLEGPQGVGKSRLVAALAGKWSADFSVDPSNKDTVDAMQGKWIVELAEMSVLMSKRVEGAALKAFITRESDRVRQAYGRLTREFPRQCLFIGTINPDADGGYLTDTTGNRRFWPVEVGGRIDIDGLKAVRNQLFAEVMDQYSKEPLYMKEETQESDARVVVASRHAEDPWLEPIAAWLETPPSSISGPLAPRIFVTPLEVFSESLGGLSKQIARRDTVRIANVMRDLGWAPGTKRMDGGRVVRGYHAPGHHPVESNRGKKAPAPIPAPAADESPLDGLI